MSLSAHALMEFGGTLQRNLSCKIICLYKTEAITVDETVHLWRNKYMTQTLDQITDLWRNKDAN